MLKIHSGGSSSQQTVLTIPANQLKQLGVGTGSGGLQTILMPVGKGKVSFVTKKTVCILDKKKKNLGAHPQNMNQFSKRMKAAAVILE